MSLLPEALYLPNSWWSCSSLFKYTFILHVIIVKICVERDYLKQTIWPSTLCGLDPYLPLTNSASLLFVQNSFGLSGCGLSSLHLIGNITQYCLSLYLANTSSGTILLFCLVGNAIQYCLSLYLANTNSGTILSFMYFTFSIFSMGTLVVESF